MLKAIIASFIGTFLALAAVGVVGVLVVDRAVDRFVGEISSRIEARLAAAREKVSSETERLGARADAAKRTLAEALNAGEGRRALLTAFGECAEKQVAGGDQPKAAIARCLQEYARVEP